MDLTFKKLNEINTKRSETSFYKIDEWSPTDWGCAAAGEMGEACNKIKKLRRRDTIDIKIDIDYEIADLERNLTLHLIILEVILNCK